VNPNSYTATDALNELRRIFQQAEWRVIDDGGYTAAQLKDGVAVNESFAALLDDERAAIAKILREADARLQPECDRDKIIEECARVAENVPTTLCQNGDMFSERVAKAIRAAKVVVPAAVNESCRADFKAGIDATHD
jgi:hypothetical protein